MNFIAVRPPPFHASEQAVQGGNLANDLYVRRSLELEGQFVHAPLDLLTGVLSRECKSSRHRRDISRNATLGQAN
jgi:hypothetical protein